MRSVRSVSLILFTALFLSGCMRLHAPAPARAQYRVPAVPEARLAAAFDLRGKRAGAYFAVALSSADTIMALPAAGDTLRIVYYEITVLEKKRTGHFGNETGALNGPSSLAGTVSLSGMRRFLVTDRGNRRIAVYNDSLRFLRSVALEGVEAPAAALEVLPGQYLVYGAAGRSFYLFRGPDIERKISAVCGKGPGARARLGKDLFNNVLCVDTENDRLVLFTARGACRREIAKSGGRFFSRPRDALAFRDYVAVLDNGNKRLALVGKSGIELGSVEHETLKEGGFLLVTDFGWLVLNEDGGFALFSDDLKFARAGAVPLKGISGAVCAGRRLIAVSESGNCIVEYELGLKRAGEVLAIRKR